jgi:hypothetical protein
MPKCCINGRKKPTRGDPPAWGWGLGKQPFHNFLCYESLTIKDCAQEKRSKREI